VRDTDVENKHLKSQVQDQESHIEKLVLKVKRITNFYKEKSDENNSILNQNTSLIQTINEKC
jgi:hypothetical protein